MTTANLATTRDEAHEALEIAEALKHAVSVHYCWVNSIDTTRDETRKHFKSSLSQKDMDASKHRIEALSRKLAAKIATL